MKTMEDCCSEYSVGGNIDCRESSSLEIEDVHFDREHSDRELASNEYSIGETSGDSPITRRSQYKMQTLSRHSILILGRAIVRLFLGMKRKDFRRRSL